MAEAAKKKKIFDGRYEVLSIVGRGAASVVYHARHVGAVNSEVALKVLMKQQSKDGAKSNNSDLLRKEALSMVSARHKYVVRLDDFHSIGDLCYLAMEYALLGDLRKFTTSKGGKLPSALGELFLNQAVEGLDFVHRVGIVHRDIKPDNILVMSEKDIRLADFGVSVLPGEASSIKELQAGVGTMSYMAPEVLEGVSYDKRSDIYSLGVSFYEMFSGVHPFEKAPLIKQLEVREDRNVPPLASLVPDLPAHISTVIMQAISYDPAKRFASCQDLLQSLGVNKSQSSKPISLTANKAPVKEAAPVKPALTVNKPAEPQQPKPLIETAATPAPAAKKAVVEAAPVIAEQPVPEPAAVDRTIRSDKPPINVDLLAKPVQNSEVESSSIKEQKPTTEQAERTTPIHPAIENRKPKRSLEDLRRLARENKSATPGLENSKRPTPPTKLKRSGVSGVKPILMAILLGAGLYFAYQYLYAGKALPKPVSQPKTMSSPIPTTSPESLAFPELSSGVYHGKIDHFVLSTPVPLSLISMGVERGIIVILGIPGWTPQIVQPEGGTDSIRVASNGFIIDLKGVVSGEKISGQISNMVTGEKGTWTAQRVAK
jgi:serine/threonine protein kinase